jgi:twitching motility protein PilT
MARIDSLFRAMMEKDSSDLHLTSGEPPLIRKDGAMERLGSQPISADQMDGLLKEICPEVSWAEFQETNDADFAYALPGVGRFRANYFRDLTGAGGVFRIIPEKILTAEQLGLSEAMLKMCRLHKGLVLVTGPTGSGKSTTLSAMIDYINRTRTDHIITIEDPVEFVHPNKKCLINQREVGTHTMSFKAALRGALREDPDIILCGELRDLETVHIALEMAETGHLVFGTLHTNTAASTVDRIIDQFPSDQQGQIRTMLASSLKGVIAQNLLKKKGGGRVAAMEVLVVNNAVRANIREGKTHQIQMSMQVGGKLGMVELNSALLKLVLTGKVDAKEAVSKAIDKDGLLSQLASRGISLDGDGPDASAPPPPPPTSGRPAGLPSHTSELSAVDVRSAMQAQKDPKEAAARIAQATQKKSRWFQ